MVFLSHLSYKFYSHKLVASFATKRQRYHIFPRFKYNWNELCKNETLLFMYFHRTATEVWVRNKLNFEIRICGVKLKNDLQKPHCMMTDSILNKDQKNKGI